MRPHEELLEPTSAGYYVPLADLLTGLIFILMVLIAALSITQREDLQNAERVETERRRVESRLAELREIESRIIEPRERAAEALQLLTSAISADLSARGVAHKAEPRAGRIQISLGEIFAAPGDAKVSPHGQEVARAIADAFRRALPCLAASSIGDPEVCRPLPAARLERAVISVRTDADAAMGDLAAISGAQALSVYAAILGFEPHLTTLYDSFARPILEFRGLGEGDTSSTGGANRSSSALELGFALERPQRRGDQWTLPPANSP